MSWLKIYSCDNHKCDYVNNLENSNDSESEDYKVRFFCLKERFFICKNAPFKLRVKKLGLRAIFFSKFGSMKDHNVNFRLAFKTTLFDHRRIWPICPRYFLPFLRTGPSNEYDSAPSRKKNWPIWTRFLDPGLTSGNRYPGFFMKAHSRLCRLNFLPPKFLPIKLFGIFV